MENIIQNLKEKYSLKTDSYYEESPYRKREFKEKEIKEHSNKISLLNEKFERRVPDKWYGFDGLGYPMPLFWYDAIYDYLTYLEEKCPEFEIYQVKIKFGGLRMYLGNVTIEEQENITQLQDLLSDNYLVY